MTDHWKKIQGWFDFGDIYKEAVTRVPKGKSAHFVEVGAWLGKSTCYMGECIRTSGKRIQFDVVDTWEGSPTEKQHAELVKSLEAKGSSLYREFLENIKRAQLGSYIHPVRSSSIAASARYRNNSLDFVFIDGDHRYEAVKQDIEAWLPKLKPNGILAGHDFHSEDVQRAVKAVLKSGYSKTGKRSWKYVKPAKPAKPQPKRIEAREQPWKPFEQWAALVPLKLPPPTVDHYADKIMRKEPFAFSRWGDGEWRGVIKHEYEILKSSGQSFSSNCDGHMFYPKMCKGLAEVLKRRPGYSLGMQPASLRMYGPILKDFLNRNAITTQWHDSDVFHTAARQDQLYKLAEALRQQQLVYVGPNYLTKLNDQLAINHFVTVPRKNCFQKLPQITEATIRACELVEGYFVIGITASMPANILVDRLYQKFGRRAAILDLGSIFDPHAGQNTRSYHKLLRSRESLKKPEQREDKSSIRKTVVRKKTKAKPKPGKSLVIVRPR